MTVVRAGFQMCLSRDRFLPGEALLGSARAVATALLALFLLSACASKPPAPKTDLPLGTQEIVEIQSALLARGFPPGPVDGVVGPRTREALSDYQRTYGLPVSGYIDSATKAALERGGGALTAVDVFSIRPLDPPYPGELGRFLQSRYGAAARSRPYEGNAWLDVSEVSLGRQAGSGEAIIVTAWQEGDEQASELSIFRRAPGGYSPILGPLPNRGFEFPGSFSNEMRDVAVTQGSGHRLWRFDGQSYQ